PYPYETVYLSTRRAVERLKGTDVAVRPWIQDFPDYAYDRRVYTPEDIRSEMRAALEAGAEGWMLWDPRVRYTVEALKPASR
ncbi:MAG: GTP-binding protein, partial [Caldilineae bacterium]